MGLKHPAKKSNRKLIHSTFGKDPEFDHLEMDYNTYCILLSALERMNFQTPKEKRIFINRQVPGKPNLWETFRRYKKTYEKIKLSKAKQLLLDRINDKINDMEEAKNFGLQLRKKRDKPEDAYAREFAFLDNKIDDIEVLIYLGVSPTRICYELSKTFKSLNPIVFHRWSDSTEHVDRLIYASKKSAENYIHLGKDFLLDWLNPEIHPELDMQHTSIVREVALYYSRMAEFADRKKYGKQIKVEDDRPQQKVLHGADLLKYLSGLNDLADKLNNTQDGEKSNESSNEESEYTDFEETE